MYSINGNISEWEKNYILKYYNYKVENQDILKSFSYNIKPSIINKIVNKNIDFDTLENEPLNISWDVEKNLLIINNKKIKVIDDNEFTYKLQKTQIKAKNGIKGLVKFLIQSSDFESPFNNHTYMILLKAYKDIKAVA